MRIRKHPAAFRTPQERREAAAMPPAWRQERIEDMLVVHPGYAETLAAIRSIHMPVKDGVLGRGEIHGLIGRSRAGKSEPIKQYIASLGSKTVDLGGGATAVVPRAVYVCGGRKTSSLTLAKRMYQQVGLRAGRAKSAQAMYEDVVDEIDHTGIELVVVDDAQFALIGTDEKSRLENTEFIVNLANRECCNIVLSGTAQIRIPVENDEHLKNRGSFPEHPVESYHWGDREGREMFRRLLSSIDAHLPFDEMSGLAEPTRAAHFWALSHGRIGIVLNYVKDAARRALNDGASRVETRHLVAAAHLRRRPNDPYAPFVTRIDAEDPRGLLSEEEQERIAEEMDPEAGELDPLEARAMLTKKGKVPRRSDAKSTGVAGVPR